MAGESIDSGGIARHEQDGRVLSGGASTDALAETMERHAPPEPDAGGTAVKDQTAETVSPAPAASTEPKLTRGQQRFSELAKARDTEKARADAAEARAKDLEARISAPQPAVAREPEPVAQPAAKPERFTYPAYQDAVEKDANLSYDQWEIDRFGAYYEWRDERNNIDGRIAEGIDARESARRVETIIAATRAKGREAYADFDAILKTGPGSATNLGPTEEQAKRRVAFVYQHPQSEHLQYAIAKDGDLAARLAGMDDIGFGLEMAKIAAPVAQPSRAEWKPPAAPFQPVNGNSPTAATHSSDLAGKGHDFDASGYREKRAAERKRAGR